MSDTAILFTYEEPGAPPSDRVGKVLSPHSFLISSSEKLNPSPSEFNIGKHVYPLPYLTVVAIG